jgi:hypothetical protein
MGTDFWWQFVNKRIVDCIHPASQRVVFRLQPGNFFFQLFDLILDVCPLFACGARATFQHSTGDWSLLGIKFFAVAA